ncbi:hypothetical protein ACWKWA_14915 [Dermacoccus abyssi]
MRSLNLTSLVSSPAVGLSVVSALGILLAIGLPRLEEWKCRRDQIRSVSARLDPILLPDGGYTQCRLTVTNGSRWTVRNIVLVRPEDIQADFSSIGPGESRHMTVSALTTEWHPITMQIIDTLGKTWWWTPDLDTPVATRTSSPIGATARLVQFTFRHLPNRYTNWLLRLPKPVLARLWGYDPEFGEDDDTLGNHLADVKRALGWAGKEEH